MPDNHRHLEESFVENHVNCLLTNYDEIVELEEQEYLDSKISRDVYNSFKRDKTDF